MTELTDADERIHPVGPDELWNDSMYFNCYDPARETGVVTRIGIHPNQPSANALLFVVRGAELAGLHFGLAAPPDGDWQDLTLEGLRYRVLGPFVHCRVESDAETVRCGLDVRPFTPPVAYHGTEGRLTDAYGVAAGHYEQSCRVRGWVEAAGVRSEVDGLGQRDHSWGVRDFQGVDRWHWISPIFGEDLSLNVFQAWTAGRASVGGMLWLDASATAVVDVDVDADLDPDGRQHAVRLRARDDGGREVEVTGERIALVALPLGATVVDEAFFRFRLRGRTGYGVFEHLHRL